MREIRAYERSKEKPSPLSDARDTDRWGHLVSNKVEPDHANPHPSVLLSRRLFLAAGAAAPPPCSTSGNASSPSSSLLPPPTLSPLSTAAAPAVSPNPSSFAVEEYLVATRPQALKASPKLSHLNSPTNPDAVLGLSAAADVAAVVTKDPQLLCAAGFTGLGLSRSDIACLVSVAGESFRCRSVASKLPYLLSLFGSYTTSSGSGYSKKAPISSEATSTGLSSPTSPSSGSVGLIIAISSGSASLRDGYSPPTWNASGQWWHAPKA
ncbi:uncharacterized protein [Aegilops tauschii subsp. strangulata]|uniref:uncharacterized protein n=1 Tax=Aegilops tauschii subsp. strangulata TaxID=200361 RepID=UPI003CC8DE26